MNSPFKFLDSNTRDDSGIFFDRDQKISLEDINGIESKGITNYVFAEVKDLLKK
jgi:hypothetical protein